MENVIKARVVRIGNSRGIRIPKVWLEQLNLGEEVELSVQRDRRIVRRARGAREGWGEAFGEMARQKDDRLLETGPATRWDGEEWEW